MRQWLSLGGIGLSTCILLGCVGPSAPTAQGGAPGQTVSGTEEIDPSQVAMTPEASLSAEDRDFLKAMSGFVVSFGNGVAPQSTAPAASYRAASLAAETPHGYAAQAASTVEASVTSDGLYTGPYPASGSLPIGYAVRPITVGESNNWLPKNPILTSTCTSETTETYWTPLLDKDSTPAYSKKVVNTEAKVTLDLYKAPYDLAPDLPSFFKAKVTMPATYSVRQAEETYQVHPEGGSARGYYWQVKDPDNRDVAIVQAFQVVKPGTTPTTVNRWVLYGDYQKIANATKPTRYAYQTYNETANTVQLFNQRLEGTNGRWIGDASWTDRTKNKSCSYAERIEPSGAVSRVFTYDDATQTVVTTESYKSDGSGDGTVKVKKKQGADLTEHQVATMQWNKNGDGNIKLTSGQRPYKATRKPPAPAKGC